MSIFWPNNQDLRSVFIISNLNRKTHPIFSEHPYIPLYRLLLGDSKRNIFQSSCSTIRDHKKIKNKRSRIRNLSGGVCGHGNKGTMAPNPLERAEDSGRTVGIVLLSRQDFEFESLQQCRVKYQRFYQLFVQKGSAGRKVKVPAIPCEIQVASDRFSKLF